MQIQTNFLGVTEIDEDRVLTFDEGIYGFDEFEKYTILDIPEQENFKLLQSIHDPYIAFVIINPWDFFKEYEIEIDNNQLKEIEISSHSQMAIFNILTISDDIENSTANLLAPIIINVNNKKARQFVLNDKIYKTKHLLFSEKI